MDYPPKPDIPSGLAELPRQIAGFPEFRLAMLSLIRSQEVNGATPLANWRAREGDDLGVMLLEMWAYVLDVLGFYDERIANEAYLRTAARPESLSRLVELIGYHPRPALAARVTLALLAEDGKGQVAVPSGVAFRSGPFGTESPQVFETEMPSVIDPRRNEWTLGPIRDASIGDDFFMNPSEAALDRGDLVLIRWGENVRRMASSRVKDFSSSEELDGNTYVSLTFEDAVSLGSDAGPGSTLVSKPSLVAGVHSILNRSRRAGRRVTTYTRIQLDSLQNEIEEEQIVIVTCGGQQHHAIVKKVVEVTGPRENVEVRVARDSLLVSDYEVTPPGTPVTRLQIQPAIPTESWIDDPQRLRVHFDMVVVGSLTRPAKHRLELDDLNPFASFEGVSEPMESEVQPGEVLLSGADGGGEQFFGVAQVDENGAGRLEPRSEADPFVNPLRTPVKTFGNLIEATRGESVVNEAIGSGDATQPFQKFLLAKSPLTYLNDPASPDGRRSTLRVSVNQLLWREVPSFFGVSPEEEIYTVRRDPVTGESVVTFGDGETGARLPTGVGNVVVSYRFGAGAAAPPANSITQLGRPVPGIRSVVNPVAAGGGADGDDPKALRETAPNSALLLGRAVSLRDFEALAYEFGVVNVYADWAWDGTTQRAVVKIWFIPNNEAPAAGNEANLKTTLLGQADPNTPLAARQATPISARLIVDLIVDSRYNSDEVELAVVDALTNPKSGLLALENIPLGCPLFRSALLAQVLSVDGAESVRALTVNGRPFGTTLTPRREGRYYNFLPELVVGNTAAGDILFAQARSENNTNQVAFRRVKPSFQSLRRNDV